MLPNLGPMRVRARAPEEAVEVAVGGPSSYRAAEDAEEYVEYRVGQGMVYVEAHQGQHNLGPFPSGGPNDSDD